MNGQVLLFGDGIKRTAEVSSCERYRYALMREWNDGLPKMLYIGLNPSYANALRDDATCKKWIGFARRLGFGGFFAGNLFGLIETHSEELRRRVRLGLRLEVVGDRNDEWLGKLIHHPQVQKIVPCWGAGVPPELAYRIDEVKRLLSHSCIRPECFGLTESGQPAHPVRLSYDTKLEALPW